MALFDRCRYSLSICLPLLPFLLFTRAGLDVQARARPRRVKAEHSAGDALHSDCSRSARTERGEWSDRSAR